MSLASLVTPDIYPRPFLNIGSSSTSGSFATTNLLLDAANEACAQTFLAPKTGNIDTVKFRTRAVTTGATLNVAIEHVTTGAVPNFTKTLWGANTEVGKIIADTDDNLWLDCALTAAASVTIGDVFAVTLRQPSSSPGNLNIAIISSSSSMADHIDGVVHLSQALGAPPTAFVISGNYALCIALRYTDGTWFTPLGAPIFDANADILNINSGSATTRVGNRFRLPFAATISGGVVALSNCAAGSAGNLVLRDDAGNSLATGAWNGDYMESSIYDAPYPILFTTPYKASANTWYRITCEPTNANNISVLGVQFDNANLMSCSAGGADYYRSLYTSGAWDDTNTLQKTAIVLLLSALDDGNTPRVIGG